MDPIFILITLLRHKIIMNIFVYVCPYACGKRALDANRICEYFSKNNSEIVNKPKDADIIILFTCGVVQSATESSIKKIVSFQKYNAELIISGCLPDIDKKGVKEVFNGITIGIKELEKIDKFFPENKIKFSSIEDQNILFDNLDEYSFSGTFKKSLKAFKGIEKVYNKIQNHIVGKLFDAQSLNYGELFSRPCFYIRISRGCLGNCTYCSIKKATGPYSSKPIDECLKEFKKGLSGGYTDFVILANDAGSYGHDINSSLPELMDKMTEIPGKYKISIRSLPPPNG